MNHKSFGNFRAVFTSVVHYAFQF